MSGDIHSKPRGDAVLKLLPEARQQAIIEKLNTRGQTYTKVRAWLNQDGLQTNEKSLRDFYSWYNLRRRFEQAQARSLDVQELLASSDPSLSPERIEAAGQMVFLNEAIEAGGTEGAKAFVSLARLRLAQKALQAESDGFKAKYEQKEREIAQKDEALRLQQERFQRETCELFLKWQNDERAKTITSSGASNAEKIEQLGQAMFAEDWTQ